MSGVALLGLAAVLGFLSSTPIGPINLNVARWAHEGRAERLWWFVAGVVVADAAVAGLAILGLLQVGLSDNVLRVIGLVGGVFFTGYGIVSLYRRNPAQTSKAQLGQGFENGKGFLTGLVFCGANPGFYAFWIYGTSLALRWSAAPAEVAILLMIGGIVIGDLIWFALFAGAVVRLRERVSLKAWVRVSALLMCVFGIFTVWRSINGNIISD